MKRLINRGKELFVYAAEIGFFHLMSANLLLQIAGFGMQIVLARILSPEDITRISVLQSFYMTLILLSQLGVSVAIVKLCSEDISTKQREELMVTGIKINAITSGLVLGVSFIIASLGLFSPSDPAINQLMKIYMFQVPFVVLVSLFTSYFQSQSKIREMSKYQIMVRILVITSIMVLSALWGLKGYVTAVVMANGIGAFIIVRVSGLSPKKISYYPLRKPVVLKICHVAKYSFLAGLIYQWTLNINVLMANYLIVEDRGIIALYSMANVFLTGIIMIPTTYNQIMVPKLSKVSNRLDIAWKLFIDMRKKMFVLVGLLFVVAQVLVPLAIQILLGSKYLESIKIFRILSLGLLTWSVYSPIGNTLMALGKVHLNVISNMVVIVVQLIMNIFLIPIYGIYGLAISFVLGGLGASIINWVMLKYVFNKVIKNG